jgi:hypothetical protein
VKLCQPASITSDCLDIVEDDVTPEPSIEPTEAASMLIT